MKCLDRGETESVVGAVSGAYNAVPRLIQNCGDLQVALGTPGCLLRPYPDLTL